MSFGRMQSRYNLTNNCEMNLRNLLKRQNHYAWGILGDYTQRKNIFLILQLREGNDRLYRSKRQAHRTTLLTTKIETK